MTKSKDVVELRDSQGVRCLIVVCCRQMELLVVNKRVVPAIHGAENPERVFELLPPKWWFDTVPQSPPPPWMRHAVVFMRYCPFCGKKLTLTKQITEEMKHDDMGRDDMDELIQFSTTLLMPDTPEGFRKAIQTGFDRPPEETTCGDETEQ